MQVRNLVFSAVFIVCGVSFAAPAQAGSCNYSAHCVSQESGVYVYRGQHNPAVSQQALALQAEQVRQERAAAELAAVNRLQASIQQQNSEIAALRAQVAEGQKRQQYRPRRRVYFGNPAFFGRNGFIGNRFFSGGTEPLPRPHRPRRQRPIK